MELCKFSNGDKRAIVMREDYTYTVTYYLKNKAIKKDVIGNYAQAESMAEDFILAEDNNGPTLLSENG
jgi:hypothetical protein